jgi:hypothetical protein
MNQKEQELHLIIAKKVLESQYGDMTINIQLKDSIPILETLNIVIQRRKRYKNLTKPR